MSENSDKKLPKRTLAQKYEIPIEFLDFEYIKTCEDVKMVERIVLILQSGEEGYYPDLTKFAEEKLRKLKPHSKLLRVENPAKKTQYLDEEEREKVEDEVNSFINSMKIQDETLEENQSAKRELPPIRKSRKQINTCPKTASKPTEQSKVMDYEKWDKYDPDAEIMKIDLNEESQREKIKLENQKNAKKLIEVIEDRTVESLTEIEKDVLANRYKEKGNECYKSKDFDEAIREYTQSIRIKPTVAAFNNRALMYLKMKNFHKAIADCNSSLKIEPDNIKALLRKGQALRGQNQLNDAFDIFERVLEIDPTNSVANQELTDLRNILPPRNAFRMKIEEVGEPVLNEPDWKKNQKIKKTKGGKLDINENKLVPSIVQNIVPDEKTPFDGFSKKQQVREKLIMPGEESAGNKKKLLIQEIN